ncbi:MAG: bifunctional adenosylcobinamide kinase/adenosylcobinamide-phosphate guanylyltransferase [Candidatus Omnitrophica bacterium]|nr:bifunctional adenosylcobinamide kinase/adenosylcobinamide-phosphate guanylyltransferase [Candidatus Omnitrophota bacterium]
MGKLIFITGGSRSGKSSLAVKIASKIKKKKVFIATCIPQDREMEERVRLHRLNRPSSWKTIEPSPDLLCLLSRETKENRVLIIDCLTLFVSGLLMRKAKEEAIKSEVKKAAETIKKGKATAVIVSNEVGCGLVPENRLGRLFRDIAGSCNQEIARYADEVFYMVAGIPIKIKGGPR